MMTSKTMVKRLIYTYGVYVILAIVFFSISFIKLDSDFGWHLQAGEMIVTHGMSTKEYFTYSMPDYPFVDFEWGSHVLVRYLYHIVGYGGLAVLYTFFGVASLYVASLKLKTGPFKSALVLLSASSLLFFIGIRVQVISLVFFSVLVYLVEYRLKSNWIYGLPLLFFLWANLHGGFVLGLFVFGLFVFSRMISERKFNGKEWVLLVISIFATLINPYGINLWRETLMIITDAQLRSTVVEWTPVFFFLKFSLWMITAVVIALAVLLRKKVPRVLGVIEVILFVSALSSVRNVPYFVLFSLFFVAQTLPLAEKELPKKKDVLLRYFQAQRVFFGIALIVFTVEFGMELYRANYFSERNYYPVNAVEYLHHHPMSGNVFSTYEWGGYLIWKYPEKKVYIDGRMSSWKVIRDGHEFNAFGEYNNLLYQQQLLIPFLSKYHIRTVVLPQTKSSRSYISRWRKELRHNKWEIIYEDKSAVIYRK